MDTSLEGQTGFDAIPINGMKRCTARFTASLSFRSNIGALSRLVETQLGKTLLFTDNAEWSEEEIVSGYRAQYHMESDKHFLEIQLSGPRKSLL
jgi:hypothetical protein